MNLNINQNEDLRILCKLGNILKFSGNRDSLIGLRTIKIGKLFETLVKITKIHSLSLPVAKTELAERVNLNASSITLSFGVT